ncbi:MmgE/PrpD family protein [Nocardioides immobilis]|uniref:MmgE/PrpD family protein n=1 Tax=Nocardioides immobilis TaxID=2049295 RepID=A0A417XU86_9ACTN|nr:MmgE/PrpD family protein [Nocardioides immobilis]RHW23777.1 MmgE/PrpD family protein [Nocardioides immobilis]
MSATHIEKFAAFAATSTRTPLPAEVSEETKRILLDTIGCVLAAVDIPTGRMGIEYGRLLGGSSDEATIMGQANRTSVHGAAFANAEMSATLDMHPIAAPGHVAPYVVPVVLALGEKLNRPGTDVMTAIAVCHEMSFRFAKTMDKNRDIKDGKADTSPVLGYASTVFGVTAAAAIMKGLGKEVVANALGIAGCTSPVNAHRAWLMHSPNPTIKYNLQPGGLVFNSLTAAYLAELGHRGDNQILDDVEYGYPRYIGTRRWEPSRLTDALGSEWRFPAESYFKPYPHCRVTHAVLDVIFDLVETNDIKPDEIESLTAYGEQWAAGVPTFMNTDIRRPYDAQFSFPHGLSLAAHRVPPGKDWQDPDVVFDASVLDVMRKVIWKSHPDWATAVSADPVARPTRVEIVARGETFVGERAYPKGSRSPDPSTYTTDEEIRAKFFHNASGVISPEDARWVADRVMNLEQIDDVSVLMARLRPSV